METKTRRWKRADLGRMPDDGNRYEVLDGELLVTPQASYDHQRAATALLVKLHDYLRASAVAEVVGPGALVWDENELQPDIQVIPGRHESRRGAKWEELPIPLLVVEVLSPSTRQRDLIKKRDAYLRLKIPTYWIVDAENQSVTVWTPASEEPLPITDVLRWSAIDGSPPLEISLASIFD